MSALNIYTKAVVETKGYLHMQAIVTLRNYIQTMPEQDIIKAIEHINDTEQL